MTTAAAKPAKTATISVLHCASPECAGLLAYEVDKEGFLYVDLAWTAQRDGDVAFFPCPRCGGRNVVETGIDSKGRQRPRVGRFEA